MMQTPNHDRIRKKKRQIEVQVRRSSSELSTDFNDKNSSTLQRMPSQNDVGADRQDDDDSMRRKPVKYRQYLIDRTNGKSRLGDSKPPCSACFVPLPVVWFADCIEQNYLFERMGSFGLFDASNLRARRICIGLGLLVNVIGTCLSIYVCFAVSTNYDIIRATAFTSGHAYKQAGSDDDPHFTIQIGMRAAAVQSFFGPSLSQTITEEVITFDEFCDASSVIVSGEDCGACDAASGSMIATLFISLFMCFPSITTSVLRLYPHYDCNCQKVFGGFAAIISVGFAIYTFVIYQFRCFRALGFGEVYVDDAGDVLDPEVDGCPVGYTTIRRNFFAGPGWIVLSIVSGCKILDMLFNLAIPTPKICRDHEEQREYEFLVKGRDEVDDHHAEVELTP
jgi:hypothetical protein